jgi:hypothetical protein
VKTDRNFAPEVNSIVIFSILVAIGIGIAIGVGVIIAILVSRINPTFNSLTNIQDYTGRIAEVTTTITPEQIGSILIKRESATIKMRATTHDQRSFRVGDRVVIVEIHEGQAWVTSAELED